jgi:hypothetical protein
MEQQKYKSFSQHSELINGEMRTQVKRVDIENGKGTVSVRYLGGDGRVLSEHEEPLTEEQVAAILDKRIVPELFKPCLLNCGVPAQEQTPRNAEMLKAEQEFNDAQIRVQAGGARRFAARPRLSRRTRRRRNN